MEDGLCKLYKMNCIAHISWELEGSRLADGPAVSDEFELGGCRFRLVLDKSKTSNTSEDGQDSQAYRILMTAKFKTKPHFHGLQGYIFFNNSSKVNYSEKNYFSFVFTKSQTEIAGGLSEVPSNVDCYLFMEKEPQKSGTQSGFAHLLDSGRLSDVVIKARGGELKGHRAVLVARCPSLDRLLVKRDSGQWSLELEGLSLDSARSLLDFLYTGQTPDPGVDSQELLRAAHSYSLPELKAACETHLISHIEESNLVQLLALARNTSSDRLKTGLVSWIKHNRLRLQSSRPDLLSCILIDLPTTS